MLLNPSIFFVPLLFLILYYGKFFLLPLSLSLFIFVIIKSLSLRLIYIFEKHLHIKINNFISFLTVFLILFLSIFFIWKLLKFNIMLVNLKSSVYQENFMTILDKLSQNSIQNFVDPILQNLENININSNQWFKLLDSVWIIYTDQNYKYHPDIYRMYNLIIDYG